MFPPPWINPPDPPGTDGILSDRGWDILFMSVIAFASGGLFTLWIG